MMSTGKRVRVLWQNCMLALSPVPFLCLGLVTYFNLAEGLNGLWRSVLAPLALLVWYAICVWLMVRSIRMGVYGQRHGTLTVRSLLRTWTVRAGQVESIVVSESIGSWGRAFYSPVVVVSTPSGPKSINLWWLAATKEPKAREYATRVRAMITGLDG